MAVDSIQLWIEKYVQAVMERFGQRVWFVGLQGSYGRGEANRQSDIDVVLILDVLSPEDIEGYRALLDRLPQREKVCGFFSGKEELYSWEPSDFFQFYFDTTPLVGSLEPLRDRISRADVQRAVWTGACNIYHMCVHNMVHERSMDVLKELYKSASFVLQAVAFLQTGRYGKKKEELSAMLGPADRAILETGTRLKQMERLEKKDCEKWSVDLLEWSSDWISQSEKEGGESISTGNPLNTVV